MKKILLLCSSSEDRVIRKLMLSMKLIFTLILLGCLQVSAHVNGQKLFTLDMNHVSVDKILSKIQKESDFRFFYNERYLKHLNPVNLTVHNASLSSVLDKLLDSTLSYRIISNNLVVISPRGVLLEQQHKIEGIVTDPKGIPLTGVTVRVKGTSIGTVTDGKGRFTLVAPENAILEISYIGYESREIAVNDQTSIKISLTESTSGLNQVVVVGYGKQKKITVTGAISSIGTKDLTQSPVANISNSLVGRLPGLLAMQRSGQPGEDQSIVRIRGIGTYSGSQEPLVLVDGIESQNYNSIDPNEIKSITILKDASATAVYGVRGANGVILITTKRGKIGKPKVSFTSNLAVSRFTRMRKNAGAYDYTRLYNQAKKYDSYITHSYAPQYTDEEIEKYKSGEDPLFYPNVDWPQVFWRKWAPQMHENLTFSGGTPGVRYFASVGYFRQTGLFSNNIVNWVKDNQSYDPQLKYNRYNFRSNFDFNITKRLTAKVNIAYQIESQLGNSIGINREIQLMTKASPVVSPGFYHDTLITLGIQGEQGSVPPDKLMRAGYQRLHQNYLDGSVRLHYDLDFITPGLSVRAAVSSQHFNAQTQTFIKTPISYEPKRLPNNSVILIPQEQQSTFSYHYSVSHHRRAYLEFGFNYSRSFGGHNIGGLLLYDESKLHDPTLAYLVPKGYQGLVGRITYNYKHRYMAEFDAGYNGTENFAKGKRFGFFPAVSAGWVASEEPFFPENKIVSLLKFRGSWGEVGNDQIGGSRFLYLPSSYVYTDNIYNFGTNGENFQSYQGSEEGKIGNPDVTWEVAKKLDIGLDMSLWDSKIKLTVDWFHEKRNNILSSLKTVPDVVAANLPAINLGKMKNGGVDGDITYFDEIGKFHYWIRANYTYAHNTILFQDEVDNPYPYENSTGHRYGQFFGYIAEGFYNTWDEVNDVNRPVYQDQNNRIQPGDIKYKDVNGDGIINKDDRVPIGYSNFPEEIIGISFGGSFKGFDLSVLFQGAGNVSVSYTSLARYGFRQGYALPEYLAKYSWTAEKYKEGGTIKFPHLSEGDVAQASNYAQSTFWIRNANYLRLKNVEIGYTFNDNLLKKLGIQSLRVYLNGNNLVTWDHMLPGIDPESSVSQSLWEPYPVTQTFNFGFKFNF